MGGMGGMDIWELPPTRLNLKVKKEYTKESALQKLFYNVYEVYVHIASPPSNGVFPPLWLQ